MVGATEQVRGGAKEDARLGRSLKGRHVAMIALGGVVGAGLFVGSAAAIGEAGPAVLVSYALAGAIVFAVMRMLGEMAVARPNLGSFNAYIRAALGHRCAFVAGWLYWYFWIITVSIETIAGAVLLSGVVPAPVWLLGLVLIAALAATNLLSVKAYGEFEFWFSALKVAAIMGFILVAAGHLAAGGGQRLGFSGLLPFAPKGWLAVLGAVPTVIFSLTGSEIASIAAAESDDPAANVAAAARTVTLRIALFYLASIGLILATVPWASLQAGHSPFLAALRVVGVPGAEALMGAVILTAVASCLNSGLYVTSRILFELAAEGDAPASLVATDRNGVPRRAILIGAGAGFAAAIASTLSPDVVFAFLLDTSGAVILLVYLLVALAQLRDRRRREAAGETTGLPMPLFPLTSYAAAGGIILVFAAMAALPGQRATFVASAVSAAVVTVAAFARNRT